MRRFDCDVCKNEVFFDSVSCERCSSKLGYVLGLDDVLVEGGNVARDGDLRKCSNAELAGCTWLTAQAGGLCESCQLTRTRPSDADAKGLRLFPIAEESKRHLLRDLTRLGFATRPKENGEPATVGRTPVFDLLSSVSESVTIGHADGVITIDLAEGDDSYREQVRQRLAEPYRTMLGHFRHESGHYYEWQLVEQTSCIDEARELFGDERADYQSEIDRHYEEGPPENWRSNYLSSYATMHPYEDFAETWAHYLHIRDTLETAIAFELVPALAPDASAREVVVGSWMPFATAMNVVNRSLGQRDLYPFVLPDKVIDKLAFIHSLRDPSSAHA
ncbi:hypothetical protein C5B85_05060 [Pseudoclavibacter sp. AY1F1]|uniref:zinc-binding metallopeptidase family protein n=1 Tax=Pseudoclavibacter sp. AY1F1 TaxID=2080583 RepID=UPI000CE829A0|nr:putative zinc-binding metallopeptidase [Pseudoclavibacter sp. AY1F1]PPF46024.1 hypothetical protein C5B85_05060 [Pseudoclavibacter sp. AY1F1]